jgi:hypothetical protein
LARQMETYAARRLRAWSVGQDPVGPSRGHATIVPVQAAPV